MQKILCGCDPEFALYNTYTGLFVSAVEKIPGTKHKPFKVPGSKVGLTVQHDGVALEIGMTPVTVDRFTKAVNTASTEIGSFVHKMYPNTGMVFQTGDAYRFDDKELASPEAQQFGCTPDYLAHQRGAQRQSPRIEDVGNIRYFGGHLHIGYDKKKENEQGYIPDWALIQLIEALGYMRYIKHDCQPSRRPLYGLAGLYRSKPYGVEYRTPTNLWWNNPEVAVRIFQTAELIINKPEASREIWTSLNFHEIQAAINDNAPMSKNLLETCTEAYNKLCAAEEETYVPSANRKAA